ncbi:spermine oxidase-like isoform X2 [Artemia franciscana]|uniref:spermine oxidase-like isoform X2 n=1 Tax=Artemia franciscana TaxID=6661 RepID=UPI0032DBEEA2
MVKFERKKVFLIQSEPLLNMDSSTSLCDVIIIGAGLAGLSAASYLIENGVFDILILEGDNRVGGRVQTFVDNSSEAVFDFGAQWIHGSTDNSLWKFAKGKNLIEEEIRTYDGEGLFLREGGREISETLVSEVKEVVNSWLEECCSFSRSHGNGIIPSSVLEYLEEKKQNYLESCDNNLDDREALLQWNIRYQIIDNACFSMEELCSKAWGEYKECEGEYCNTIKGGFMKIVENLLESVPEENIIKNSKVFSIQLVDDLNINGAVLVKSTSGYYLANHVIYTPSISCLKTNCDIFVPSLENPILKGISHISMGSINKIFLIFQDKFWDDDTKGFQIVFDDTNGNEKEWYHDLTGFDIFPFHRNCLVAWVGGHGALLTEKLDCQTLKSDCHNLLQRFYLKRHIPPIETIHRTKWHSNSLIKGAYSYRTAPFDMCLQDPIWSKEDKPLLLFAGEAYSYSHYATAHGAYESGRDQASKLVKWRKGIL